MFYKEKITAFCKMVKSTNGIGLLLSVTILITCCGCGIKNKCEPVRLNPSGDISVHDPAVIKDGDTYYMFCTGGGRHGDIIPIRTSKDLINWKRAGCVFDKLPEWCEKLVPGTRGSWAPDISFFNGEYHLYYSVSTFGRNISAIGLATNVTLDSTSPYYKWIDHGMVVNSNEGVDDFNAIDANLVYENKKTAWLCWGSFWGGIMMRQINPETGLLEKSNSQLYKLCSRPRYKDHVTPPVEGAVEAPFIIKHKNWWYLFVSRDFCCRGVNSNYNVVVGRSKKVTGPYLDKNGIDLINDGGSPVLEAATDNWHGIGHEAILSDDGTDYIFCHAYDAKSGRPILQISTICWKDGWPVTAPMP